MKFLDQAKIFIKSGDGGNGCVGFRREKNVEFGGPDGGDGGRGGNVEIHCVDNLNTLIDFRYRQHYKAERGKDGMGKNRSGPQGKTAIIKVPVGTEILNEAKEILFADLTKAGQQIVIAKGGEGGHGNTRFKSSTNQAPRRADPGWPGEECWVWLRLKMIADAGLIGLPNAGKSTFLAAVTRAHPKIGDYPFTTIHPNLGVLRRQHEELVLADIPGLIEGASDGIGLGIQFLGHVERCPVLLHLIDGLEEDPLTAYKTVRREIKAYGQGLVDKSEIVALNKCDALPSEEVEKKRRALEGMTGQTVTSISAIAGEGMDSVINQLFERVKISNSEESETDPQVL